MSVINQNLLLTPEGYQISRSVRLRSSASAYFNRTISSTPTSWTASFWVKRGALGGYQTIFGSRTSGLGAAYIQFNSNDTFGVANNATAVATTAVFRDPSAWYHFVVNWTSGNSVSIWCNGVLQSVTGSISGANQLFTSSWTNTLGRYGDSASQYFDGYLTEVNFIDGQALTPSSFGETDSITGVWKPKKYAGTYGTNGFYLNFSDNSAATAAAIGKDSSGNGNNWTPNNISVTAGVTYDSMLDVPTMYADGGNGRGNYAVVNPLSKQAVTISDGNLGFSGTGTLSATTTFAYPPSGKWYCEFQITSTPENSTNELIGFGPVGVAGGVTRAYASNGQWFNGSTWVSFGSAWSANDVIGVAADVDGFQISIYKNGTLQGTAQSYTFADSAPHLRARASGTTVMNANFGQRPFAYTPPTGFKALNTQNLPDATIKKGNAYFDVTTYTGTGAAQSIVNSGAMQPDLVWLKSRSSGAYSHVLYDSVRGATKRLFSNLTNAEDTAATGLTAFNSDGFTLGSQTTTNDSAVTFVGWQWKESASAGFDIVTYTGTGGGAARTVAHSLGVAPKLMINKGRSAGTTGTDHWVVYHGNFSAGDYILLSATNAKANSSNYWGNTVPTSSNFYVGGGAANVGNENGIGYVSYLFAEVAGFSKFGSFVTNGSADGPFVYLGFRPAYILMKRTDSTESWIIWDTRRNPSNVIDKYLAADLSSAEGTSAYWDATANGMKLRVALSNGANYIYAAFAENPFKNSLAR